MFRSSRTSTARRARMPLALLVGLVILSVAGAPVLACYDTNSIENRAKNLIVFVVDGFGYGAQSLARLALSTPDNPLRLESLPYVGVLNVFGRTALRGDQGSALWGLIWGLGADPGEVPAQVAERASWFSVAKESGQRTLGVVSDGNLAQSVWPLGALVPPTQAGVVPPAKLPAAVVPDFLFGWTPGGAEWTSAPSGATVRVSDKWDPNPSEKAGLWYLLPGAPSNPLSGEASPAIPQVVDQAINRLSASKEGFVLLVHAGELGKAFEKRDLGLVTAQLALLDEAVGKALNFTDSAEGTAVLLVSTGDPVGLTILDNFNPRFLDGLQKPVAKVAANVASASTVDEAQAQLKTGLGLEVTATDADVLRNMKAADLESAISTRVAERVGVRFGSSGNAINPAPIMGYGPGSWVYGRLAKAPDIPALAVGQLWLDPSSLTRTATVKQ